MVISINKNFDEYKEFFWKGLTARETAFAIAAVLSGAGTYSLCGMVAHLPMQACIWLALGVCIPVAAYGFLKIHGMGVPTFIRRRAATTINGELFFQTGFPQAEGLPPDGKKKPSMGRFRIFAGKKEEEAQDGL